ncbi:MULTISPECIES: SDR family NAD(P)-dependent oxidoreductase [unclassified Corallococcus]|uniref:SDR family NAD(P)-dependent oxidoreductase n=1 Tax=unclassified Corallococcus TaxID=2685029 RepID=UPI001A8E6AEE|nr:MULTISPECIES: SDR family oxidoreductase [unclassified Corallococcus]MBN9687800.1 SDR family oxidoreductase [Corallococcus sp. NCSPR001]WAS88387.1 SDR family NAD(P)-dependent oxidoreductase [Corallococcus sp. NCRR]
MSDQVLITGASRGIGRAAAERFSKEGWRVINVSRSPCTVPGVVNVPVDLAAPGWEPAVEAALRDGAGQGRLSVIHNAALYEHDDALTMDADHLRRVLEVNVVAPLVLNRLARPLLTDGSSLLYVSSTLGEKAVKGVASYVTTKHALIGMMRATCQDLAGTQVHTACVCPGFTDTEMLREHMGTDPAVRASVAGMTTFGRLITPEEIAGVLYLCATTPVLNGAVIHANLGQVER